MSTKHDILGASFEAGDHVWVYCKVTATSRGGMPGEPAQPTDIVVEVDAPNGVGEKTQLNLYSKQVNKCNHQPGGSVVING